MDASELNHLADTVRWVVLLKLADAAATEDELRALVLTFHDMLGVKLLDDVVPAEKQEAYIGIHAINVGRGLALRRRRTMLWS